MAAEHPRGFIVSVDEVREKFRCAGIVTLFIRGADARELAATAVQEEHPGHQSRTKGQPGGG